MIDWKHKRGLTLVEMLVVVGVIATLAAIVIVATRGVESQSSESIVVNAFAVLKSALREYYEYADEFPQQPIRGGGGAAALAHMQLMYSALDVVPACQGIVRGIDKILVPKRDNLSIVARCYDPWGTPLDYIYARGVDSFPELISAGADRRFGTADDISSKGK